MRTGLIDRIKHALNSDLIKVSSRNLIQLIVRLAIGLINIKLFALLLGASGMALFGHFINFIQLLGNLSSGGINHGITKFVAQYRYSEHRKKLILSNGVVIALAISIMVSILLFVFSEFIAQKVLFDVSYEGVIRSASIFVFSYVLSNLILSFLNGAKAYGKYIRLNLIMVILNFVIATPALYWYGLEGLIYAQYISSLLSLLWAIYICDLRQIKIRLFKFSPYVVKRLLIFGAMLFVASITTPLVKMVIRYVIVEACSIYDAGIWEGVSRISNTYTGLVISSLGLYFMPRISELMSFKKIHVELKSALIVVVPLAMLVSGIIYVSRDLVIAILFSEEFRGMSDLFVYQCIGDVLKISAWFFSITLMIKEHAKIFIYLDLLMSVLIIVNALWMIPLFGVVASVQIYLINNLIFLILVIIAYKIISKKSKDTV